MKQPIPVYQAVLDNQPERFPGFERLIRRKHAEYENQSQPFDKMTEDLKITHWLSSLTFWDSENEEKIRLNATQRHDINLVLQKRYALLQWEQGSGKTLAGIATGLYRMLLQNIHSTWVVSSAISIRNNWDVVLKNYGLSYVFVERLKDLERIRAGDFVLITLNKVSTYRKQLVKAVRRLKQIFSLFWMKVMKSPIHRASAARLFFPVFAAAGQSFLLREPVPETISLNLLRSWNFFTTIPSI